MMQVRPEMGDSYGGDVLRLSCGLRHCKRSGLCQLSIARHSASTRAISGLQGNPRGLLGLPTNTADANDCPAPLDGFRGSGGGWLARGSGPSVQPGERIVLDCEYYHPARHPPPSRTLSSLDELGFIRSYSATAYEHSICSRRMQIPRFAHSLTLWSSLKDVQRVRRGLGTRHSRLASRRRATAECVSNIRQGQPLDRLERPVQRLRPRSRSLRQTWA